MAYVGLSLVLNRRITGVEVSRWQGEGGCQRGRESVTLPGSEGKGRPGDEGDR